MERTLSASLEGVGLLQHRSHEGASGKWVVTHRDRTGCDGYDLWLPSQDAPAVWSQWLEIEKIVPAGHRALDWLRTEAGIPWYGVDMDDKNLPQELGLQSAISLTKGCYRGQEIVARVHYRGHLDRQLGAVAIRHDSLPAKGSPVSANGGHIGEVTSSIPSPLLGCPLALCIMKGPPLPPGTLVDVVYGDSTHPAEVVSLPLRG